MRRQQIAWISNFSLAFYLFISDFVTLAKYHDDINDMISGAAFLGGCYQVS